MYAMYVMHTSHELTWAQSGQTLESPGQKGTLYR